MSAIVPSVLVDDSGRRRRALRRMGRAVSLLLFIWLAVLALAWLGIEPLGNLDFVDPVIGHVRPTPLPAHIESAVTAGRVIVPPARPSAPSTIAGRSGSTEPRAGEDTGPRENTGHGKRLNATPIRNLPVPGSSSAPTGTTTPTIRAQPSAGSGAGNQKSAESRQTEGSSSSGKSQSAPGQAKRPTTAPSTGPGQSTTSPGHTKEPGQTSAKTTLPPKVSTSAKGSTTAIGHGNRTLPP
jgi:hypothetical protein